MGVLLLAIPTTSFSPSAVQRLPSHNSRVKLDASFNVPTLDASFNVPDSYLEGRGFGCALFLAGTAGVVGATGASWPRALLRTATSARPRLIAAAAIAASVIFAVAGAVRSSGNRSVEAEKLAPPGEVKKLDGHLTNVLGKKPLFGLIAKRGSGKGQRRSNFGWDLQANLDVHAITQGP